MADDVLGQISDAKEFATTLLARVDQHIMRAIASVPVPLGQYSLQLGIDDPLNGVLVGQQATICNPWSGTIFSFRTWCDDGTPKAVLDPLTGLLKPVVTPATPPSVTMAFTLAPLGSPFLRLSMGPAFVVTTDGLLQDLSVVNEADTGGGPNIVDPTGLALSITGFRTYLSAGDKLFATITAITGTPHLAAVEFLCRLR